MYYVYMLRCVDDTIYTGITNDIKRRFIEHLRKDNTKKSKGAKYTLAHKAKKMEGFWECENRSSALKLECFVKKLSKYQKEKIIQNAK
ncbi:MAG: GIY-YIG nuclease family protein [Eubacteriales bacterium]|nr:GIY-YIG nuclease family protein [Eubacteriales bacterium]